MTARRSLAVSRELPAAAVGFVLGAAVWNPIVGQISDDTRSRWERRHPYLYGVPVPLAFAFTLLWRPPEQLVVEQ